MARPPAETPEAEQRPAAILAAARPLAATPAHKEANTREKRCRTPKRQRFIGLVRYSDKYHTYYADDEKINLENFAAGKIDCLLTCKKVSEGIDISSVTNIILFSSDRSRLVTTQRIGRALRLDKNNPEKKATVVDFVIEDSEENDNNADADRAEWLTELSQTRRCEHEK